MFSLKKYKLVPKDGSSGAKPVCAFFSSPNGCRNGDKCKFLHGSPQLAIATAQFSEIGSVISSESEGQVPNRAKDEEVFLEAKLLNTESTETEAPKKKKKKRKNKRKSSTGTDCSDIFANPKKQASTAVHKGTAQPPTKKQKQNETEAANHDVIQTSRAPAPATTIDDFRRLVSILPVVPFSIPVEATVINTSDKKTSPAVSTCDNPSVGLSNKEDKSYPLPNSTDTGRKWVKAVLKCRKHERFNNLFDFGKIKELNNAAGITSDWIKAKPFGAWCASNPQVIAIDCEMCETQDPLSGVKNPRSLCRVSIINGEKPDEVLLDTLVKPTWPVTDYRTRINGIAKEHLDSVEFTLRHAQAFMMALCSDQTVIVGQALQNDLAALNMEHYCIADSSLLFQASDSSSASVSLRDLVKSIFQEKMPETHDSVNDAKKALACVQYWVEKDGNVDTVDRTPRHNGHQLFVHRIPKPCTDHHLSKMFLKHTSIEPTEVEKIEFVGDTGKTHVSFKSMRHANLAFDTLDGPAEEDLSGKLQKKVYLRNGGYVRVRKMVYLKRFGDTPSKSTDSKDMKSGHEIHTQT